MECVDEKYESLLRLIFPPDVYPTVYDTLLHFNWKNTKHHAESFRQHCVHTGSYMQKFCHERNLLQDTWNGITHATLVGFLHDIGKPFVGKRTKKEFCYTGHAQVGARLVYLRFKDEIPEETLLRMTIAIDSHMCILRNSELSKADILRINAIVHLYLPTLDLVPILECLHRADAMGKMPRCEDEHPTYMLESPISYRKDKKIAIFLIGPSGSGKSTLATLLKSQLSAFGSVNHLERDKVLMEFALEGETYHMCRNRVYDDKTLKKCFQERWKDVLKTADDQIIIVDTVQNYYHPEFQQFVHRFRIGMYCVPMSLIDDNLHGKKRNVEFPPEKWMGYYPVLTESKDCDWRLEVGTGIWQVIPDLVKRYLDRCVSIPLERQPTMASLWDDGHDAIDAQFNRKTLKISTQYAFKDGQIIRVGYLDGKDVIYGPTRYYRGEFLLETSEGVFMLRSGFPTFRKHMDIVDDFDTIVVTPKFDGILVNVLYVPKQHRHYELLKSAFPETHYPKYGLLFVGSKQKLLMETSLRECFDEVIGNDFERFVGRYDRYLKDEILTLHFEMLLKERRDELTVYYPENTWVFLGVTTFTDTTRSFTLSESTDFKALERRELKTWAEFEDYKKRQHRELLRGNLKTEPEGFVLYAYKNGLKDIIKSKFVEYFAINYPQRHAEEIGEIFRNPLLRNRFQKYRMMKDLKSRLNPLMKELDEYLTEKMQLGRKESALFLKDHMDELDAFQLRIDEFTNETRMKPISLRKTLRWNFPKKEAILEQVFRPFYIFLYRMSNYNFDLNSSDDEMSVMRRIGCNPGHCAESTMYVKENEEEKV